MAQKMKDAMFGMDRQLPMGLKRKEMRSVMGAGGLNDYPDTAEEISSVQEKEAAKLRAHPLKPGQRQ